MLHYLAMKARFLISFALKGLKRAWVQDSPKLAHCYAFFATAIFIVLLHCYYRHYKQLVQVEQLIG